MATRKRRRSSYGLPFSRGDYSPRHPRRKKRKKATKKRAASKRKKKGKMPAAALAGLRKYRAALKAKASGGTRKRKKSKKRSAPAVRAPARKKRKLTRAHIAAMQRGRATKKQLRAWAGMDPEARFEAQEARAESARMRKSVQAWADRMQSEDRPGMHAPVIVVAPPLRGKFKRAPKQTGFQFARTTRGMKSVASTRGGRRRSGQQSASRRANKRRSNPIYFPRQPAYKGGRPARSRWWISDVYKGRTRRPLVFIARATKREAERGAMQLLNRYRAKSVELSGPYLREPTPQTARK